MTQGNDHRGSGAVGEPQSSGETVSLGGPGATTGDAPSVGTHTASGAMQPTATVQRPVGIGVAWPLPPPDERTPDADAAFDRAQGPNEVLPRLRSLVHRARHDRTALTVPELAEAIGLLVAIMESGKERPFEREPGDVYPIDNWADVHVEMIDLITACLSKSDVLSQDMAEQHGDQVLDLVDHLFEHTRNKLGTNPRNDPAMRGNGGVDPYAESSQWARAALFRGLVWLVEALRHEGADRHSKAISRARGMCQNFLELESDCPPMQEYGYHAPCLYEWDKEWMRSLVPHVFPAAAADKRRFLAAWGGFLAENPSEELFLDPVFLGLCERGLDLTESDTYGPVLPDPEFAVGRLLAYAHLHFEGFGHDHPLLMKFWEGSRHRQRAGFVHYAGKYIRIDCPSGRDFDGPRVIASWEWLLEHPDPEILPMLGPWICSRSRMFTPDKLADLTLRTLTATDGRLNDEAGLQHSLKRLVDAAPEKTLRGLELFFSKENMDNQPFRKALYLANRRPWNDAMETLSSSDSPQTQMRASNLGGFLAGVRWKFQCQQRKQAAELLGGGGAQ